jgi:glycosyltransferase involved in cell wall biosynthesis
VDAARGLSRPSLLLDIRNVGPIYNGTTRAALGIAEGFKRLSPDWDIALLANARAAEFHALERAYPDWPVCTALPGRAFTAALRLSQPWHISELIDLHRLSAFNVCLMLDTISWDAIYPAPPHLDGTWKFLADHADAVLFDSAFTQERFRARFPTDPAVPTFVSYLSFEPTEYVRTDALRPTSADERYILVVGNHLDHKDVRRTTELLTTAFPFRRVRVLGPPCPGSRQTVSQPSGQLSEPEVHRLFAHADCVVFPSFYEGFGFPTVMALAYSRTLLARRSALLQEIAARCSPAGGRLVVFDRRDQLVDLVGRVVHGDDVPVEPLGGALHAGRPKTWTDVARDILQFLAPLVRDPSRSRWIARERAIQHLFAYPT